ncbi:response regulator [Phenylobacterium sp.]|uniref:response regulator n=1 Tax=Phenylobacterium sp. TaxID=1871053 RepID=UPI002722C1B4|nr:response regulator [Phenylobacterium sp.]MDO8801082.1 response regulator [Phenylobacterium sp.]
MRRTICLVDDDDIFREFLALELRALGQPVDEAPDARTAEALMAKSTYAAAIVDIIMPDVDGLEMIGRIRRRWPSTRIIAISGGGRISADECLEMAGHLGADAHMKKPLRGRDILTLIDAEPT